MFSFVPFIVTVKLPGVSAVLRIVQILKKACVPCPLLRQHQQKKFVINTKEGICSPTVFEHLSGKKVQRFGLQTCTAVQTDPMF